MSADLQIKLLRVLETRTFRRVGGNEELKVNTRILSSTNRDLQEAIKSGKLREDFYYRLNVFPLVLPPLRQRKEDIPPLAQHFLDRIEEREKAGFREIETEAIAALNEHSWPGNVRELRNVIHRAYVLSNPPVISASAVNSVLGHPTLKVPAASAAASSSVVQFKVGESLADAERRLLSKTLEFAKGDKKKAASMLKVPLRNLNTKLKAYGLA